MKTKILTFPRSKKDPKTIETEINKILSKYNMIYATQTESPTTGKIIVTLILDKYDKENTIIKKIKAIREPSTARTEAEMNKFMSQKDIQIKFFTQSFARNSINTIIFYEKSKIIDNPEAN